MIYTVFSYYYIGPVIFAVYIFALFVCVRYILHSSKLKITLTELYLCLGLAALFLVKLSCSEFYDVLLATRFYFGFIIFYVYFKIRNQLNVDRLLMILACATVLETILVNTIIPIELLPNYLDSREKAVSHTTEIFGFYQRPYGFGGNPSVTGSLLIALVALRKDKKNVLLLYLPVFATILTYSGSSYIAIIFLALLRSKKFLSLLIAIFIAGIVIADLYGYLPFKIMTKISPEHLKYLWQYKITEIENYLQSISLFEFIFGNLYPDGYLSICSDFAILWMFKAHGALGVVLFFSIVYLSMKRENAHALFILILTSIHYYVVFSLPGQFVLAYALTRPKFDERLNIFRPAVLPAQNSRSL